MTATSDTRLATYGTLAPGRANHHQLSDLQGHWQQGTVKGKLVPSGWGAALGYPGLVLDEDAASIDVFLFESLELPAHWERLDAFEGANYRRAIARVTTPAGDVDACIYVLA
jgi:gamma-glutamylcyclotransferase (GGCT)/AIG2-like uncharacterized protein YtfP